MNFYEKELYTNIVHMHKLFMVGSTTNKLGEFIDFYLWSFFVTTYIFMRIIVLTEEPIQIFLLFMCTTIFIIA